MKNAAFIAMVLASCGGGAGAASTSPPSPNAATAASRTEQCNRMSAWVRTTLEKGRAASTLAESSTVFSKAAGSAPEGIDDPPLLDLRAHAAEQFASIAKEFSTADAQSRANAKNAEATIDRVGTRIEDVGAVNRKIHDLCAPQTSR